MRTIRVSWIYLIAVALLAASPAWAGKGEYGTRGGHIGLGGLMAFENADLAVSEGTVGELDDAIGFNARIGYRVHPRVALEAAFDYYNDFDFTGLAADAAEGAASGDLALGEGFFLGANAKLYPHLGRIQPYAVLGAGVLDFSFVEIEDVGLFAGKSQFAGRLGAGVDFYVTETFSLNFEGSYLLPASGDDLEQLEIIPMLFNLQYRGLPF